MISLIVAMDKNGLIGKENNLPWNLSADLAYFKKVTIGHTIIMGRKTYQSIGQPLPGRQNVVITRDPDFVAEGCTICHSIEDALKYGKNEEVFIIGGANIYTEFFPYADRLYTTMIDDSFDGDTYFPQIDFNLWSISWEEKGIKDEKNPYDYRFLVYDRKVIN